MQENIDTYISMFKEEGILMTNEDIEELLSHIDSIGNLFHTKYISKIENNYKKYEKNSNNIL